VEKIYLVTDCPYSIEAMMRCGHKNMLVSFYYLYKAYRNGNDSKTHRALVEAHKHGANIMLDSGTHSFYTSRGNLSEIDEFFDLYIKYLKEYHYMFSRIIELDVEEYIGLATVDKMTEKLREQVGRDIVPVWHKQRGFNRWREMCKCNRYVGYSFKGKPLYGNEKFFAVSEKEKTKVHGFAMGSFGMLKKHPWGSVDFSTWKKRAAYGLVFVPVKDLIRDKFWDTNYGNTPHIAVSEASKHTKEYIGNWSPRVRKVVEKYFRELGERHFDDGERYTIEKLGKYEEEEERSAALALRYEVNILFFKELEERLQPGVCDIGEAKSLNRLF